MVNGKLRPDASCAQQSLAPGEPLGGSGLRFVPIEHAGNRSACPEEAGLVAKLLRALDGQDWIASDGRTRPLTVDDLLIVAPYNAHVARVFTVCSSVSPTSCVFMRSISSRNAACSSGGLCPWMGTA